MGSTPFLHDRDLLDSNVPDFTAWVTEANSACASLPVSLDLDRGFALERAPGADPSQNLGAFVVVSLYTRVMPMQSRAHCFAVDENAHSHRRCLSSIHVVADRVGVPTSSNRHNHISHLAEHFT